MTEQKFEVYKTIFETWRYEVDSYWQRNNYFAAFETGALAGCWYLIEHSHFLVALAFSLIGLASTIIWLLSSIAVHSYVRYWWKAIKDIENKLSLKDDGFDFAGKHPGSGLHPSLLTHIIPVLFSLAWIVIFIYGVCRLCACKVN